MPQTSLSQQLRKLAAPQTSQLVDKTLKPSLLFDFKEAASIGRDTFYSIGLTGLRELEEINPVFNQYERTLFDSTSVNFERSVETAEKNKNLDAEIKRFLIHCSPYFLLNPTHKALEWLINRYHIQDYNTDSLIMLALPYFETNTFAQVIQLINLKKHPSWDWLRPIKKQGTPLSKTALLNRAASDISFFKFVCSMPLSATEVYQEKQGNFLASLFTFYCTTIIGAFEHSATISELHVSHLLPSLTAGLSSCIIDYVASSYMILSCLVAKIQLSSIVLQTLFTKIVQVDVKKMRTEAVLLMVILCQCDKATTEKSLLMLIKSDWFIHCLTSVAKSGIVVFPLIIDIMSSCIDAISGEKEKEILTEAKTLVINILDRFHFSDDEAEEIFRLFVGCCTTWKEEKQASLNWIAKLLQSLERRYPKSFDDVISDSKYSTVMKKVMGFSADYKGQSDLFEKLHHPNPVIRIQAIRAVAEQLEPIKLSWLSETILERMSDDDSGVVLAVIQLPDDYLEKLLGKLVLINSLLNLANKIWCKKDKKWSKLTPTVFTTLGKLLKDDYDELTLLKTIIPFLFVPNSHDLLAAKAILSSELSSVNRFLKSICENIKIEKLTDVQLRTAVWKSLFDPYTFSFQIDEDVIKSCYGVSTIHKFIVVLSAAATLPSKSDPLRSVKLVHLIDGLVKDSELVYGKPRELNVNSIRKIVNLCRNEKLPLQVIQYFLRTVIHKTDINVNKINCWWDMNDVSQEFLYSLFKTSLDIHNNFSTPFFNVFFSRITSSLQKKIHFRKSEDYCKLLCNIIVKSPDIAFECLNELNNYLTKLQSEDLIWTVELSSNNVIIPTLLIGLSSTVGEVRQLAFEIMNYIYISVTKNDEVLSPFVTFIKEIIVWENEISCDSDQTFVAIYMLLSPDPAVQSGHTVNLQQEMSKVRDTLFSIAVDKSPSHVIASLLQLLVYINSVDIMKKLIPFAVKILDEQKISDYQNIIVESIIKKIEPSVTPVFEDDEMWNLADKCLKLHNSQLLIGLDKIPPAVLFLKKITNELFDGLTDDRKCKLLDLAVTVNADSENGEANIAVMSMVKRIVFDGSHVLPIFCSMKDAKPPPPPNAQKPRRSWRRARSIDILRTIDWRKGMSLLELIQNKKKINNVEILLPVLFDILRRCLEFEEQAPVEYTKQLLLSSILHFCEKLSEEGKLSTVPKHVFQVELIVQSIRASQNPQTHHHALLVLVEIAALVPEKVLHDIMPIFTFVGSSILRMDDTYSFQIILKIIETVIPILVKNIKGKEDLFSVQDVLQVFVDALLDIPEHRRLTLLLKLITTLDSGGSYLWLFICLVAQSEVLTADTSKIQTESVAKSYEKGKLKVLKNMCLEFPAIALIKTMYNVMKHVASLPHDKDGKGADKKRKSRDSTVTIFDVEKNSGKQLRHYKYILINFISSFLATPSFIDMILIHNHNDTDEDLVLSFKSLVHEVLDYLQAVSEQVRITVNQPSSKYWKAMQHIVEDIHGKVNAVLPNTIFLNMIRSILSSDNCPAKIHRKMLEILNWRLQSTELDEDGLVALVPVILSIIQSEISTSTDSQIAQQASFISLKLLARQIASSYPDVFEKALACVTEVVKKGLKADSSESNDAVLASAVLCLAEMVATLGSNAIRFLPKFMPAIIQTVSRARSDPNVPEVLLLSVVTTVQKVLEHHTVFINPYLDSIFTELCLISSTFHEKNSQKSYVNSKLDTIRKTFAEKLELRVLLPAVESSYAQLLELEEYGAISYLMSLLSDSLTGLYDWKDLQIFLIKCLDFRNEVADPDAIALVEPAVISCTVSVVLKMNEKEFRMFYSFINKWVAVLADNKVNERLKHRAISFYKLCGSLAETLKSIFVPYAKEFLTNAANLLEKCNRGKLKCKQLFFNDSKSGMKDSKELVKSILNVFLTLFRHDNEHFITEDRFNVIMKPLVDQLESELCVNDDTLDKLLAPCLAHLATSIGDDSLWKKYNYEILLKTQHERVKVRLAAIKTICELAKKLGDSYLPLLPETIPFLSELLEDEEEVVEKACRSAVQDLESVLGEEISKFF